MHISATCLTGKVNLIHDQEDNNTGSWGNANPAASPFPFLFCFVQKRNARVFPCHAKKKQIAWNIEYKTGSNKSGAKRNESAISCQICRSTLRVWNICSFSCRLSLPVLSMSLPLILDTCVRIKDTSFATTPALFLILEFLTRQITVVGHANYKCQLGSSPETPTSIEFACFKTFVDLHNSKKSAENNTDLNCAGTTVICAENTELST